MAGKRKINSEVDSESKKSKNEEWDFTFLVNFYALLFCLTTDFVSHRSEFTTRRPLKSGYLVEIREFWTKNPDHLPAYTSGILWIYEYFLGIEPASFLDKAPECVLFFVHK